MTKLHYEIPEGDTRRAAFALQAIQTAAPLIERGDAVEASEVLLAAVLELAKDLLHPVLVRV